jgi:16S rRNA processing protein RimM
MELVVGRVGRPHGVRGVVTVEVRTDSPELRFAPGAVLGTEPSRPGGLVVAGARRHRGRLLLTFGGVGDRTAAEELRGLLLTVEVVPDERPQDPEEYYDHQLVGLLVRTATAEVGLVTEVLHLPAQDVLVVRTPAGCDVLVPFVAEIVPEVDLAAGRIRIDPPAGLLSDEAQV